MEEDIDETIGAVNVDTSASVKPYKPSRARLGASQRILRMETSDLYNAAGEDVEVSPVPKWFGLNWADIVLNIAVLALIPGLFAAYGGHLAAEAIPDPKRERKVKRIFWLMFVVFVLATGWQQFRVSESDLARDTRETWADALALRELQPNVTPPLFAYLKAPSTVGIAKPAPVRSYVTFEGYPRFPQDIKNGQISNPRDFKPGDALAFDVYYRQTGLNPIEIINSSRWLYTKPDYKDETQKALIVDFEDLMRKDQKSGVWKSAASTLTLSEGRFFTAFALNGKEYRQVTQAELDQLGLGMEIAFVIAQITYSDLGAVHHLRRCVWLQPPASAPGVWHLCAGFNNSD